MNQPITWGRLLHWSDFIMKFVGIFHIGIDSNLDIDLTFLSAIVLKLSPSLDLPNALFTAIYPT